jgi:Mg2+/Co2+ transporter CorB
MESVFLSIIFLVCLIVVSGFFAAAETAITGVSQATIHRLKLEGNERAKIISILRKDKEKLISALLLGNTMCNTFASFLAANVAAKILDDHYSWVFGIIMAFIIFVFAEVMPKSYAFEHTEKFSLASAKILSRIIKVVNPFVGAVQILVHFILSSCFASKIKANASSATEELRGAIELHHHEGLVVKNDRDMLGGVLDMKDMEISQIMIHRSNISAINIDSSIEDIIAQASAGKHTRIPLWRDDPDNIVGILNIKDLLSEVNKHRADISNIDIASIATKPWFVPENSTLREQLNEFRKRCNHFALVIDEYGALLGLVTLENIIEEIVGEIQDEHDSAREDIVANSDGSYNIMGIASIRDINRELEWNLPTDNASTVAGLIMHETMRVPKIGESFVLYNINFIVIERYYNQIKGVKAQPVDI